MRAILLMTLLSGVSLMAQTTGTIKASIADAAGKGIVGIYVVATPMGPAGGQTLTALTTTNGDVTFSAVPPASYILCVQGPGTTYLDPCRWSNPPQVTVTSGQVATATIPRILQGSTLRVRFDDDPKKKYIAQAATKYPEPLLGVLASTKMFHPLRITANDDSGRTMEVAIPFDTPLQLLINADGLILTDDHGAAIGPKAADPPGNSSTAIPVTHGSGKANPDIKIKVTGNR